MCRHLNETIGFTNRRRAPNGGKCGRGSSPPSGGEGPRGPPPPSRTYLRYFQDQIYSNQLFSSCLFLGGLYRSEHKPGLNCRAQFNTSIYLVVRYQNDRLYIVQQFIIKLNTILIWFASDKINFFFQCNECLCSDEFINYCLSVNRHLCDVGHATEINKLDSLSSPMVETEYVLKLINYTLYKHLDGINNCSIRG